MKTILTSAAMAAADRFTIEKIGVPACVLMERAADSIASEVIRYASLKEILPLNLKVVVYAGAGNNGGDGFACARILHLKGYQVTIRFVGDLDRMTDETSRQCTICKNLGITLAETETNADVIIDALFGIGLKRDISGKYLEAVDEMNRSKAYIISADIPSGIAADTGKVLGSAVRADLTVTMQFAKPGHYFYPGCEYTGRLSIAEIGITCDIDEISSNETNRVILTLEDSDLYSLIPARDPAGNKGSFGKVLIIAGSENMSGAGYLSAYAALRSGAGMVKILTSAANRIIYQQQLPEALLGVYSSYTEAVRLIEANLSWCTSIVVGPGMGNTIDTTMIVRYLLEHHGELPLVIDADGLNALHGELSLLTGHDGTITITPHMMEMSRLTGEDLSVIKDNPIRSASLLTMITGVNCILKDARSIITTSDGSIFMNINGNDGMASAGSGDVLSGICGALAARGIDLNMIGPTAAFIHGKAGDHAALINGKSYMIASDIIEGLKQLL